MDSFWLLDAEARSAVDVNDASHLTDIRELPLCEFLGDLGKILLVGVHLPSSQAGVSGKHGEPADLFGNGPVVDDLFAITDVEDAFRLSRVRMDIIVPLEGLIDFENRFLELREGWLVLVPGHRKSKGSAYNVFTLTTDRVLECPANIEGSHRETPLSL